MRLPSSCMWRRYSRTARSAMRRSSSQSPSLEVLRERFRRFRGAVGRSLARYIRLLAEFLQVILMRGVLASGEIEHLVHARLRWLWRCSARATSSQAASSPASRRAFAAMRAAIS